MQATSEVRRIFVEKKKAFAVEADGLCKDLRSDLGIRTLEKVRILNRYDISGLSGEEYLTAKTDVFSEPPVDLSYDEDIDLSDACYVLAIESLPGQYDQRADSAAQCVQILTCREKPLVRTARVLAFYGSLTQAQKDAAARYLINPVESRQASLLKPETLEDVLEAPDDVAVIDSFISFSKEQIGELRESMKEPSYVAAAVRSYREFIDRVSAGEDPKEAESMVMNHLLLAFNRGGSFTTQYLQGKKKDNLPSGDYSGRYGLLSGFIVKKNARAGTLSIRLSSETIPIRGDYLSIRVNDREIASFPIGKAEKLGDVLIVQGLHPQMIEKVPDGALVFQMSETAYTRDLLQGKASRKTPVVIAVGEQIDGEKRSVRLHISVRDGMQ